MGSDFFRAVKNSKAEKIPWKGDASLDPNLSVATLPKGMSWLTMKSNKLFVRSRYEELWEIIEKDFLLLKSGEMIPNMHQRMIILGNTGIGKTVMLNYFLKRALEKGYRVLFETREERYYFHDGTVDCERLSEMNLDRFRYDRSVLFLVDHLIDRSPPTCNAYTVAPMSPDPSNYNEFRKNRCGVLWVPLPSNEEILLMNNAEFNIVDIQDRLELFGPIPRSVFTPAKDMDALHAQLAGKIESFDYEEFVSSSMAITGELPEKKGGLSWWVVHVTTKNLRVASEVRWASDEIRNRVLEKYQTRNLKDLERSIVKALSKPNYTPAAEYQYWAAMKIASGKELESVVVGENGASSKKEKRVFKFIAHDMVFVSKFDVEMLTKEPNKLFYSKKVNEALCDAAAVMNDELLLFQMTIGDTHNMREKSWMDYCKSAVANKLKGVRIIFLVPYMRKFDTGKAMEVFEEVKVNIPTYLEVTELTPFLYHQAKKKDY